MHTPAFLLNGTATEAQVFAYLTAHYSNVVHHPRVDIRVMGRRVLPDFGLYLGHGGPTVVDSNGLLLDTFIELKSQSTRGSTMSKVSHTIDTGAHLWDKTGLVYLILWDFARKAISDVDLERYENQARRKCVGFDNLELVTDPRAFARRVKALRRARRSVPKRLVRKIIGCFGPEVLDTALRTIEREDHSAEH